MNFDINRLFRQIVHDFTQHRKILLISAAVIYGFLLLSSSISMAGDGNGRGEFYAIFFGIMLLLGGFLFTSTIFNDLTEAPNRHFSLALPTSHLEKTISKLLISSVGYVAMLAIGLTVLSAFNSLMIKVVKGRDFAMFNMFDIESLTLIKVYLVLQSIFFLGAAWFRRYSFLKTLLAILVATILIAAIWAGWARILFDDFVSNGDFNFRFSGKDVFFNMEDDLTVFAKVGYYLFWLGLAPLMWLVSYFKISEKEV